MQGRKDVRGSKEDSEEPCAAIAFNITSMLDRKTIQWVQCDNCDKWVHNHCVSLSEQSDDYIDKIEFISDSCVQ